MEVTESGVERDQISISEILFLCSRIVPEPITPTAPLDLPALCPLPLSLRVFPADPAFTALSLHSFHSPPEETSGALRIILDASSCTCKMMQTAHQDEPSSLLQRAYGWTCSGHSWPTTYSHVNEKGEGAWRQPLLNRPTVLNHVLFKKSLPFSVPFDEALSTPSGHLEWGWVLPTVSFPEKPKGF